MKITSKQLAELLDAREYDNEITPEEEKLARDNNLVVVFGASDDLCEILGAIDDEVGCYNGGNFFINKNGVSDITEEDEEVLNKYGVLDQIKDQNRGITAIWDQDGYSWTYKTDIPHETFEIVDNGNKYCRGIVFSLEDI